MKTNESRSTRRHPHSSEVPATDRTTQDVARLERMSQKSRSPVDRWATAITRIAGTGIAILIHIIWFFAWIALNLGVFGIEPFDPYPFSLLTTIVSLEAIFLTLFVLISQNRMSHEADRRAAIDLEINVLAEKENTMTLRILHDISAHLGLKGQVTKELAELLKETKLDELSQKLEKALPPEK